MSKPPKTPTDRLRKRQPPQIRLRICLDEEVLQEVAALQAELGRATATGAPSDEIEAKLVEARGRQAEATEELTFRSIGRKAFQELKELHPPTPEQCQEWREASSKPDPSDPTKTVLGETDPDYNPDTFSVALIAACMVPPMEPEELQEITDTWNEPEFLQLWTAAISVCNVSRVGTWGKG
jgi:hypothetical protein